MLERWGELTIEGMTGTASFQGSRVSVGDEVMLEVAYLRTRVRPSRAHSATEGSCGSLKALPGGAGSTRASPCGGPNPLRRPGRGVAASQSNSETRPASATAPL
jgi:hypothetical protein